MIMPPQESFYATLKTEGIIRQFPTRALTCCTIFEYIEVWYNRQRLHSSLDYLSPEVFERQFVSDINVSAKMGQDQLACCCTPVDHTRHLRVWGA